MKVRVDCYLGDSPHIDISFLERRNRWLPFTGIYLEFLLKGGYEEQVDFQIEPQNADIVVSRHSWNRFFLNVQKSGDVHFKVNIGGKSVITQPFKFSVVDTKVPLLFSVLNLFSYPVTDVRFFANRLSENIVNGTRIHLFTPISLERLSGDNFAFNESYWKLYELLFSILTERGIVVYISPFGQRVPYPLSLLEKLKPVLWEMMKRGSKFRLVWDFSEGLRKKELGSFVDSMLHRFSNDIPVVLQNNMVDKVGGEGYSYQFFNVKRGDSLELNEKGIKIARVQEKISDFYQLRRFVVNAVKSNYGVEYVYYPKAKSLHDMHFSLSRALYLGYEDANKE